VVMALQFVFFVLFFDAESRRRGRRGRSCGSGEIGGVGDEVGGVLGDGGLFILIEFFYTIFAAG
jgi:hypothetical protein